MSGAEMLMLVALGFAVASLVALVVGRGIWGIATRLRRRRINTELPDVVARLKAERGALLADVAMRVRKTEVVLSEMKSRLAEQAAEVSRHRNRLELMGRAALDREAAYNAKEEEARSLRDQLGPLEAELAKRTMSNQSLAEQIAHRDETVARLSREIADLREIVSEQESELTEYERRAPSPLIPRMHEPDRIGAHERFARRIDDLAALSREIASQREMLARERDELSALRLSGAAASATEAETAAEAARALADRSLEIEEKLAAAERETAALAGEIDSLGEESHPEYEDAFPSASEIGAPEATIEDVPRTRPAANVVNLAARIRALQRDGGG